jgi:D-amino peptidase
MLRKGDLSVMIVDDMEGISGIDNYLQIMYGYKEFEEFGRVQITEDVNAAIRGLRTAGATDVRIADWHGSGGPSANIIPERLEKNVKLFQDPDFEKRLSNAASGPVKASVFIGFHAMADTRDGFLSHTITLEPRVKVNDRPVGETYLTALALSEYDIPVIMATGDQALVREASSFLPGIEAVQVKTTSNRRTTNCLPLAEARKLIEDAATRALSRRSEFKPIRIKKPIKVEISYPIKDYADLAEVIPKASRASEKAVSYVADSWAEANRFIRTANSLATQLRMRSLMEELNKLEKVQEISRNVRDKRMAEWAYQ